MLRPLVTVPISAVHGLLAGARARGIASPAWLEAVLRRAGIDAGLLGQDGARVTVAQYLGLFDAVKDALGDECMGLLSRPLRIGSFALMTRSTLGARTVQAALGRLAQAFALLQDDAALVCVHEGALGGAALEFRDDVAVRENFLDELLLRVFWRLLVWLHGGRLVPRRFDFAFGQPAYAADYRSIFPAPARFAQARSAVWFDAAALEVPVRRDVQALQAFLRATPGNLVGPHLVERTASARVRALLQHTRPSWPGLEAAADRLHMSVSNLQRHLAAEGTAYQQLKDELRRDMAIVRLSSSPAPLAELAQELGFTDSTAFQRAFKGWTGSAPGAYRTRIREDRA